jgi:hypothetical protein
MRDEIYGKMVRCPECGELSEIIPLDNAFSYSGTHCTHGQGGTHYPSDYGSPVTACCEAPVDEDDAWKS